MFTVTVVSNPGVSTTLALEGNVRSGALAELARLIKDARRNQMQVVLDLGEVTLLDRAAVRFLAGQMKRGVALMNCPVYIKHWISQETTHGPEQ